MSEGIDVKKWLIRFVREDLRIIATFMFVLLLLIYGFAMMMGALSIGTVDFRTPSINPVNKAGLPDTDSDSLPDIIEGTEARPCTRGERVTTDGGAFLGYCTDTDPTKVDTDGDLFTDGVEDAMGTNPTSFFNPGWIYIVILIYASVFMFFRVYQNDPLKEYKEFEMKASSGVSGGQGKFAYSGKSVFGQKKADDVSEEERKQAIAQDARFQRMTSENQVKKERVQKKRNWGALLIQLAIAAFLSIMIFLFATN